MRWIVNVRQSPRIEKLSFRRQRNRFMEASEEYEREKPRLPCQRADAGWSATVSEAELMRLMRALMSEKVLGPGISDAGGCPWRRAHDKHRT